MIIIKNVNCLLININENIKIKAFKKQYVYIEYVLHMHYYKGIKEVYIMASTIQVRVDEELKRRSDDLFRELGTDTTTAIRIFLTQAVANNGFPFEIKRVEKPEPSIYAALTEEQILTSLEKARQQTKNGRCRNADLMVAEMREKYGL